LYLASLTAGSVTFCKEKCAAEPFLGLEKHEKYVSHEKNPGCLGCIGDEILPSYVGIMINHSKDSYLKKTPYAL